MKIAPLPLNIEESKPSFSTCEDMPSSDISPHFPISMDEESDGSLGDEENDIQTEMRDFLDRMQYVSDSSEDN